MARHTHPFGVRLLLVLALFAWTARPAAADPVAVTSGFLNVYWDGCCAGFQMTGEGFSMGVESNFHISHQIGTLQVGTMADPNLNAAISGRGGATVNGERVRNPADPHGADFIYFGGNLFFDAEPFLVVDADPSSLFAEFATRFRMSGTLFGYATFDRTGTPLFAVDLTGQGTTRLTTMRRFEAGDPNFTSFYANQLFLFEPADEAPVPEPTSMLLLGSGLAGLAIRRRRAARGSRQRDCADACGD
ncbi:MAG TPA: PEP-CTERM sorting domain-containing protein [Vicinamibacterales bacterium]|nr:PEP-CTERM sorting domain-containing protein [Vicinamibacterales bacterium]